MKPPPAFDAYAASYDADFTYSATGQAQRRQVWRYLQGCLDGVGDILEINCGTGEDALRLAQRGFRVVATDQSAAMLEVAQRKAAAANSGGPVQWIQADFLSLAARLEGRQFDLIFSNFGGLNCLSPDDTPAAVRQFAALLRPGGRLFLVYLTRDCLWEQLYYRWKGDPTRARRRKTEGPVRARIMDGEVSVWYYSPAKLRRLFAPVFTLQTAKPAGLLLPPSYLEHFFRSRPGLLALLERLERLTGHRTLARLADHMALVFHKTENA